MQELYHYGIKRKSGRYPWGSGKDPYQRETALKEKKEKMETRLTSRFNRSDQKILSRQEKANRLYNKAIKKENSFFSSQKSANKSYKKADKAQRKVNQMTYSNSKAYKRYEKKVSKWGLNENPEIKKRGQEYINQVIENSKGSYNAMLRRKI